MENQDEPSLGTSQDRVTSGPSEAPTGSLVLVVGYEGSDPARRALAAAGRLLQGREGWVEVVQVVAVPASEVPATPSADVIDSAGPAEHELHYQVRSLLDQPWRLTSRSGAVAEQLMATARAIAEEGGPSRTVVIVVGSDRRLNFTVPVQLARLSTFPVVIVP